MLKKLFFQNNSNKIIIFAAEKQNQYGFKTKKPFHCYG